jgi:site-specific DNA-methyltransferase (adenine-specific)
MKNKIIHGDCLDVLPTLKAESFRLIYIDPPFNTGKEQIKRSVRATRDRYGKHLGFGGKRYTTELKSKIGYEDKFASVHEYVAFLGGCLKLAKPLLTLDGSIFVHLDYHMVHYCKVLLLDTLFGMDCFKNEIIWSFDYGGKPKTKWPAKHNTILWYVRDPDKYIFNWSEIDRVPYKAPALAGPEKAARGKVPTDVWDMTIVPTNSKEKTGYPTQKPMHLLRRIVAVHSTPGDRVLDFFAGSGTLGAVAGELGRKFILIDSNKMATTLMFERLAKYSPQYSSISKG